VLAELGAERALAVRGEDGLDEVSITGQTRGWHYDGTGFEPVTIDPGEFGLATAPLESITARDAAESGRMFLSVLRGEHGPGRDVVLLNAAAALFVAGRVGSIAEGVKLAAESVDTGNALGKFEELASLTAGMRRGTGANR
jgi:anthranilate phosphoribosyltransferase